MEEITLESIPRISWEELQTRFEGQESFEALSPLATCLIRVREFKPLIANVSHAGHRVREEIQAKMLIEESQRLVEEDVGVDLFLDSFPIQIIALDSRYEYDVNRPRERAVYLKPFQSWGKRVWQQPPTKEELAFSLEKYDEFHDVVEFVVSFMQKVFGSTLVFDLHSYNHQRPSSAGKSTPSFDLVLLDEDRKAHQATIAFLKTQLQAIQTPEGLATVQENAIFEKDGAVAERLRPFLPKVLTLPIEIKKFYVDERTGEVFPEVVRSLQASLNEIFPKVFDFFRQKTTS